MAREFKLPDLGEGVHEGEVLKVVVAAGDAVTEGDILLEVETDKAAVDIPSPFTGTVAAVHVAPGDVVKVGQVLVTFGDAAATAASQRAMTAAEETPPPADTAVKAPSTRSPSAAGRGPVPASPATRRLARELGVELAKVTPSGPAGLVTADDVRAHAEKTAAEETTAGAAAPEIVPDAGTAPRRNQPARPMDTTAPELPDFSRWGATERRPLRTIRRAIARQMSLSWQQIPHVTSQHRADVTRVEAFRNKHKGAVAKNGGKLSLTIFALKAVVAALQRFPDFNGSLDTATGDVIHKHYYHVGVAVDTDDGLVVPVLRDVDRKSIADLAIELNELVTRTRERKVSRDDMQGGTFTITNMGPLGGGHATPIINFPEVAIMGMGAASLEPVVVKKDDGGHGFAARLILPLTLSFDHRLLDGADGAKFMNFVIRLLEDPDQLMLTMS
jgi:pyruvate dehydrogenase E2 component (dihydrolipoamide acetyltransferase)